MILTNVVFTGAFLMAVARLGSLHALEQDKGNPFWRRRLDAPLPSADTVGRVFALLDQAGLRRLLHGLYDRLKRNKAVDLLDGRGRAYPGGPLSGDPDRSSTTDQNSGDDDLGPDLGDDPFVKESLDPDGHRLWA